MSYHLEKGISGIFWVDQEDKKDLFAHELLKVEFLGTFPKRPSSRFDFVYKMEILES